MPKTFIRMHDLASTKERKGRYPVSKATIYRWIAAGTFPSPVKLSAGTSVFDSDDLDAYDATCMALKKA